MRVERWKLLELIWNLHDSYDYFMGIAVLIYEVKFHHRVVALNMAFNIGDLISC